MTVVRAFLVSCLLTAGHLHAAGAQQARLIAHTQQVFVQSLDSTLPRVRLGRWLATLRSVPASSRHWEVNDCGEGGDGRAAPRCVEAILDLAHDTVAHASLLVAGLDQKPAKVAVFSLYVVAGDSIVQFKRLASWAEYVRRSRR